MQYEDITGKIIGCAMAVHATLGNGFQEVIYQRALAIEIQCAKVNFEREKEMPIFYRGEHIGTRRVDFFVEGKIMVELKAVIALEDVHLAQAINYPEAYKIFPDAGGGRGGRGLKPLALAIDTFVKLPPTRGILFIFQHCKLYFLHYEPGSF